MNVSSSGTEEADAAEALFLSQFECRMIQPSTQPPIRMPAEKVPSSSASSSMSSSASSSATESPHLVPRAVAPGPSPIPHIFPTPANTLFALSSVVPSSIEEMSATRSSRPLALTRDPFPRAYVGVGEKSTDVAPVDALLSALLSSQATPSQCAKPSTHFLDTIVPPDEFS